MEKLGYWAAQEQYSLNQLLEFVVEAEKVGFAGTMTSDHFHPWWHDNAFGNFTWVWIAAAAERTKKMQFITGVTAPIYRYRPAIIAQAFGMTVEQLTAFINELDLTPTELTQLYAILHEVLMQLRKLEDAHVAIKRSFGRFLICGAAGKLISVIVFLDPNVTNPPFDPNKVY